MPVYSARFDPLSTALGDLQKSLNYRTETGEPGGETDLIKHTLNYMLDLGAALEANDLDTVQRLLNKTAPIN